MNEGASLEPGLEEVAIDRERVAEHLTTLRELSWGKRGRVAALIETPQPHRHVMRTTVQVIKGKGFAGDHEKKSFYRGALVPGREVTAISAEVLRTLGIAHHVVGDNLITEGIDLALLEPDDSLEVGEVLLRRSERPHRPCRTFRDRTSPEAFAVVARYGYRGALFVVEREGTITVGDPLTIVPAQPSV